LSYLIITINFIATFVESYLLVSVGFIFLSFRGSRWTAPYVERFIALAVTIGVKTLLLYCLISAGMNLGLNWIDEAQSISASTRHDALSAESEGFSGRPGRTRTGDPLLRRQMLYPPELRARV
jgi:type IV secretory pathway TrbL component